MLPPSTRCPCYYTHPGPPSRGEEEGATAAAAGGGEGRGAPLQCGGPQQQGAQALQVPLCQLHRPAPRLQQLHWEGRTTIASQVLGPSSSSLVVFWSSARAQLILSSGLLEYC